MVIYPHISLIFGIYKLLFWVIYNFLNSSLFYTTLTFLSIRRYKAVNFLCQPPRSTTAVSMLSYFNMVVERIALKPRKP